MAFLFSMKPTFKETVQYLYQRVPSFQQIGVKAYKPNLGNILALLEGIGNPHRDLKCIHVGGTNGKGSSSSMLASILTSAGYRTGLYTSPHLKSFTERVRIDGIPIPESTVVDFIEETKHLIEKIQPSFFEVTTALAFYHFKQEQTDINVIEVGLGGRLDSTNVINPIVSLITNIGHDHLDLLGPGLEDVAMEKAGIIKANTPIVISEYQSFSAPVFSEAARRLSAPICFAEEKYNVIWKGGTIEFEFQKNLITINPDLKGDYQIKNIKGVLSVLEELLKKGWTIKPEDVRNGLEQVGRLSGLRGRWQQIGFDPMIVCDTAHNPEGISEVLNQLKKLKFEKLYWVLGMVSDKDPRSILTLLPNNAYYYFCQAKIQRALGADELCLIATDIGLTGTVITDVNEALKAAKKAASNNDLILVGGSTYVVAELDEL